MSTHYFDPKNFPQPFAWLAHRVSYGETDAMTVLYHAEYIHIFERSRGEFSRQHGMDYRQIEAGGIMLPVREAYCRYRSPARYDDLVQVQVAISEWKRASVRFVYAMYDESRHILLAEGSTEHACVNLEGRPVPIPNWLKTAFSERVGAAAPNPARGE